MVRVKICGVTTPADAALCAALGVDAIGLNFAAGSPRCLALERAREIVASLPRTLLWVGVFVDADERQLRETIDAVGLDCVQLHGDEPPELVSRFLPHAYKAIRVRGAESIAEAARYPGDYLLLDAYVPDAAGGTGARFDWSLASELARTRRLTLAGGLTPDNVAEAIRVVQPYCVDVASGVEREPGQKDPDKLRAFVEQARAAPAPRD